MLTEEERKEKGRENRERIASTKQQKEEGTFSLQTVHDLVPGPRVPTTQKDMQMHLSGRFPHLFRDPINRAERRAWDKWWKQKGRGLTKPVKKGERF